MVRKLPANREVGSAQRNRRCPIEIAIEIGGCDFDPDFDPDFDSDLDEEPKEARASRCRGFLDSPPEHQTLRHSL